MSPIAPMNPMSPLLPGFTRIDIDQAVTPALHVCTIAPEKCGKTTFAATFPAPIAVVYTDSNTVKSIANALIDLGQPRKFQQIQWIHIRSSLEMLNDDASNRQVYGAEWAKARNAIVTATAPGSGIRSVVMDTATELWAVCRLSHFGKLEKVMPHQYAIPKGDFRWLLQQVTQSQVNSLWIHKVKKQYVNDRWDGRYEMDGMDQIPFDVSLTAEHSLDMDVATSKPVFKLEIKRSSFNAGQVVGQTLTDRNIDLLVLASMCMPGKEHFFV